MVYTDLFRDLLLLVLPNFHESDDSEPTVLHIYLKTKKDQNIDKHTCNSTAEAPFFRREIFVGQHIN